MSDCVQGSSASLGSGFETKDGGPYKLDRVSDVGLVLTHTVRRDLQEHGTYSKAEIREAMFRRLVKWKTRVQADVEAWFELALCGNLRWYELMLMDDGKFWVTGTHVAVLPWAVSNELEESGYWERVEEYKESPKIEEIFKEARKGTQRP